MARRKWELDKKWISPRVKTRTKTSPIHSSFLFKHKDFKPHPLSWVLWNFRKTCWGWRKDGCPLLTCRGQSPRGVKGPNTEAFEGRDKFSSSGKHTSLFHYCLNFLGCMCWQRKGANVLPQSESVFPLEILEGICPCYLLKSWQCKKKI